MCANYLRAATVATLLLALTAIPLFGGCGGDKWESKGPKLYKDEDRKPLPTLVSDPTPGPTSYASACPEPPEPFDYDSLPIEMANPVMNSDPTTPWQDYVGRDSWTRVAVRPKADGGVEYIRLRYDNKADIMELIIDDDVGARPDPSKRTYIADLGDDGVNVVNDIEDPYVCGYASQIIADFQELAKAQALYDTLAGELGKDQIKECVKQVQARLPAFVKNNGMIRDVQVSLPLNLGPYVVSVYFTDGLRLSGVYTRTIHDMSTMDGSERVSFIDSGRILDRGIVSGAYQDPYLRVALNDGSIAVCDNPNDPEMVNELEFLEGLKKRLNIDEIMDTYVANQWNMVYSCTN